MSDLEYLFTPAAGRPTTALIRRTVLDGVRQNGDTNEHRVANVACLPDDVLLEIATSYLDPRTLFNLCLTARAISKLILPLLYRSIELKSEEHCKNALSFLERNPDIARQVKLLKLRPRAAGKVSENILLSRIFKLAKNLKNLTTFAWDGEQMPRGSTDIFRALLTSCPRLKKITSVLNIQPNMETSRPEILTNTASLSLTFKSSNTRDPFLVDPEAYSTPCSPLVELIDASPNLTSLTILSEVNSSGYPKTHIADIVDVFGSRLPSLRHLSLGALELIQNHLPHGGGNSTCPFHFLMQFLHAHSRLESFNILTNVLEFPVGSLPNLVSFSGNAVLLPGSHPVAHLQRMDIPRTAWCLAGPSPYTRIIPMFQLTLRHLTVSRFYLFDDDAATFKLDMIFTRLPLLASITINDASYGTEVEVQQWNSLYRALGILRNRINPRLAELDINFVNDSGSFKPESLKQQAMQAFNWGPRSLESIKSSISTTSEILLQRSEFQVVTQGLPVTVAAFETLSLKGKRKTLYYRFDL
ncbi:hypothetical protein C8J56DRAFT_1096524 [Mycena floridula]|nr:hypothetical protein C8J56DRAFT_1096524 [Mycena floridula]